MEMSTTTLHSYSCSIFPLTQQVQPHEFHLKVPTLLPFFRAPRLNAVLLAKYSRWDSNAEEMGRPAKRFDFGSQDEGGRMKNHQWWSKDLEEDEAVGIMEEVIDSIWILKVFRSYGWTLPAVLLSPLLATGAEAFLIAMAFPLDSQQLLLHTTGCPVRNGRDPEFRLGGVGGEGRDHRMLQVALGQTW